MNGLVTVGAFVGEDLVSAHLWLRHEHRIYSHLAASNESGYAIGAAYAVHDHALRFFSAHGGRIVDLGGTGGTRDARDGLESFKRGFSNRSVQNWLCGKIIDAQAYNALCRQLGRTDDFFPAYRGA
jgi:lipid II:glycine glycyltransferase (peptidoglycan interpeptide bridge formation enzyme)